MTTQPLAGVTAGRIIRLTFRDEAEAAEPWEWPASEDELLELSTRRFERLPHRPANLGEVPAGAREALAPVLGEVALAQLFVMPRTVRLRDGDIARWVVSPTEVLAVTPRRVAVWLDDPAGGRVRAVIDTDRIAAILDRTVLLHGRLELVGDVESIVVRYNTVGRSDVHELLRSFRPATTSVAVTADLPQGGVDPAALPHKWMALARSADVHPHRRTPMRIAAGELRPARPILHTGIAVLTGTELVLATDPTPDVRMAQYGVDLVVVRRDRVVSLSGDGETLVVVVEAWPGRVTLEVEAHPSLVAATVAVLGPAIEPR